jgi:hypothetical protein
MVRTGDDGAPEVRRELWHLCAPLYSICSCTELGGPKISVFFDHCVMVVCSICDAFSLVFFVREEVNNGTT